MATGKKRVFKKRRFFKRVAAVTKQSYSSLTLKRMAFPLPPKVRFSFRCNETADSTITIGQGYDNWSYPLYFPGAFKDNAGTPKFAGGFIPFMMNYSKAVVRGVRVHARAMSINTGANSNCNMFTAILPESQADFYGSMSAQSEFQNLSNSVQAKKWFVGSADGAYGYAQDYRYVDLFKFNGYGVIVANQIVRSPSNQITTPSSAEAVNMPNYMIALQHGAGEASQTLRVEITFDFDIEFSELTFLPQYISDFTVITWARRT